MPFTNCGKEVQPWSRPSIFTSSSIKSYPHPPARSCCRSQIRQGSQSSAAAPSALQTLDSLDRRRHRCCLWLGLVLD